MEKLLLVLLSIVIYSSGYSQTDNRLDAQQWIEDITFFSDKIQKTIPDFDKRVDQKAFNAKLEQLKSKAPTSSKDEMVLLLQEILGLVEDEGCSINPFQKELSYQVLPLKTYWFKDEVYICDASEKYRNIIGDNTIAINGLRTDNLFDQLSKVIPGDNEHSKKYNFLLYAQITAWLKSIGLNKEGLLSTDIDDVFVHYKTVENDELALDRMQWKGVELFFAN